MFLWCFWWCGNWTGFRKGNSVSRIGSEIVAQNYVLPRLVGWQGAESPQPGRNVVPGCPLVIQSTARSESQRGPEALELQQEAESWWELLKLEMPGYHARGGDKSFKSASSGTGCTVFRSHCEIPARWCPSEKGFQVCSLRIPDVLPLLVGMDHSLLAHSSSVELSEKGRHRGSLGLWYQVVWDTQEQEAAFLAGPLSKCFRKDRLTVSWCLFFSSNGGKSLFSFCVLPGNGHLVSIEHTSHGQHYVRLFPRIICGSPWNCHKGGIPYAIQAERIADNWLKHRQRLEFAIVCSALKSC